MKYKKLVLTLFVAALAATSLLSATSNSCDPCAPCDRCDPCASCCDGFSLGFDILWWHPCFHDMDYATTFTPDFTSTGEIKGKFDHVCHDYDPGVRVFLTKECFWCDWDLFVEYTYYHSEETDRQSVEDTAGEITSNFIHSVAAVDDGNEGSARHKFDYQTIDVLFGRHFCWCGDHYFMPFFGVEGLKFNRHLSTVVTDDTPAQATNAGPISAIYNWRADTRALGLKIGTEYSHTLCDCFDLFVRASASLLAGELESESQSVNVTDTLPGSADIVNNDLRFDHADCCIFIPGYHLQAGFSWCHCCCGQETTFRIGYEFLEWRNVPTPKRFFSSTIAGAEGDSTRGKGTTIGMHGLFAGVNLHF